MSRCTLTRAATVAVLLQLSFLAWSCHALAAEGVEGEVPTLPVSCADVADDGACEGKAPEEEGEEGLDRHVLLMQTQLGSLRASAAAAQEQQAAELLQLKAKMKDLEATLAEERTTAAKEKQRLEAQLQGSQASLIGSLQGFKASAQEALGEGTEAWKRGWPPAPRLATDYNGIQWPTLRYTGSEEEHVFYLGDWGGLVSHDGVAVPANNARGDKRHGKLVLPVDKSAQQMIAKQMILLDEKVKPRYVLNGGDNFYWGGLRSKCGHTAKEFVEANMKQYQVIWTDVYKNLTLLPWLSVLGNHDYGGFHYTAAWDQQIAYTWHNNNWVMPGQYWAQKVEYPDKDTSIDYFFLDTNNFDTWSPGIDPNHNICSMYHQSYFASCGETGPNGVHDCVKWFRNLWNAQIAWLKEKIDKSTADWRIIVTHFPPEWGYRTWKPLLTDYKVDLFIGSHRHMQELHPVESHWLNNFGTAVIVGGGGGGITSEWVPLGRRDQYGFMDLVITKNVIRVDAYDEHGSKWDTMDVQRKLKDWETPPPTPAPTDNNTEDKSLGASASTVLDPSDGRYAPLAREADSDEVPPSSIEGASMENAPQEGELSVETAPPEEEEGP